MSAPKAEFGVPKQGAGLRVLHLSVFPDPMNRAPEELLDAWFTLADVASAVADQGAAVTVVQASGRDAHLDRDGVRYRFLRTPPVRRAHRRAGFWATPVSRGLQALLRSEAPDVVHFHSLSFPCHLRLVADALPKTPVLVQDHAERPPARWLRGLSRRGLQAVAGATFTAVEQAHPFFRAGLFRPGLPVYVVPETSSRFTPGDRETARVQTGLHGDPAFLWVGHLDGNKDPLTVLEAAAEAFPRLPDPRLWLVYRNAPLLEHVRRTVAGTDALRGRVHFLGHQSRPHVELLLRAADFFVLASHREGSGVALLEALACGTPPIVTDIPSFRQLTGHATVGALFPAENTGALAEALLESSRRDRASARLATRHHFEERLSFDVLGRELVAAYTDLLARGRGAPRRLLGAPAGVTFGPYRDGDELELSALFRAVFAREATPEWWRWKLLGHATEVDPVIVGRDPDGRAVFQMGGVPRRAVLAGRPVTAIVAVDAMTRPDRRRAGLLGEGCEQLFALWREQGVSVVLGLPNEQWGSRTALLGWRPLFPLQWHVRLLAPEALLARRSGLRWLARTRTPARAWNAWWDRRQRAAPARGGQEVLIDDEVPSDEELDELGPHGVDGASFALIPDARWFRWRYLDSPNARYSVVSARAEGRLVGWLSYAIRDEGHRAVALVCELCGPPPPPDVERELLADLTRRLRGKGVELVAALAAPGTARSQSLRRAGFLPAWGSFVVHAAVLDPELEASALRGAGAWRLEAGDFDVV